MKRKFPAIGYIISSKMITDQWKKPLFMYREKPSNDQDSGWRIFSGLESDEYTDNPDNMAIYNPSTILKIDSSIENILLNGVWSVYERESIKSKRSKVLDFKLEDDYMVKHRLMGNRIIEINNLFQRSIDEDGSLLYTTWDKSVRISIWNSDKEKDILYKEQQDTITQRKEDDVKILEKFDFSDSKILRIGYMISESDEYKSYKVIFGSSIIDKEIVQLAIYIDNDADKDWAIDTWKKIRILEE